MPVSIPVSSPKVDPKATGQVTPVPTEAQDAQYVTIPEKDMLGKGHPGVGINLQQYEPGKTYLVHPDVAREINRILKVYDAETIRILRPEFKDTMAAAKERSMI
jgi:hypothetical protein